MAELREQYGRDGYAVVRSVIDADLIAEADQHVAWLMQRNPELRPEQLHHWLMADDPFWVRLISDARILDQVQALLGPDLALFSSHYICKRAQDGQAVLWHQDAAYWKLDPMRAVSVWLAVDSSNAENGCMRVIPGSQRSDLMGLEQNEDGRNVLGSGLGVDQVDEAAAVDVLLEPGDMSLHHPGLIHGSNPNHSDKRRCGLTIRYIPTDVSVLDSDFFANLFLLRGQALQGINAYVPKPEWNAQRHMSFRGCEG